MTKIVNVADTCVSLKPVLPPAGRNHERQSAPLVTACARMQSPRLFVRTIKKLYAKPAIKPTSQYGPCSDANNSAEIHIDFACKCRGEPSRNLGDTSHRISHARQNNSSMIGTIRVARMVRNTNTSTLCRKSDGMELRKDPVIGFWNSQ